MRQVDVNREWLMRSESLDLYHLSFVDSILVLYYKTAPGVCFVAGVAEKDLPKIANETSQAILRQEPEVMGTVMIGRIHFPPPPSKIHGIWPVTEQDPRIAAFFAKAADRLWMMIDEYGRWDTFQHYLKVEMDTDLSTPEPSRENTCEYWWLLGRLDEDASLVACSKYEEHGVYVERAQRVLPVFTSGMYAEMEAMRLSRSGHPKLLPEPIRCLGCFLAGFYKEVGNQILRSVQLNNQWTIKGYLCDETPDPSQPGCHFFLRDSNGNRYAMCGCARNGTGPVWYAKSWDRNGTYFIPECRLVAW
ncbi:MAG: hypothetical protein ACE15F_20055 [bacterium]